MTPRIGYRSVALLRLADLASRPPAIRAAQQYRLAVLAGAALDEARVPPERCRAHPGPDHLLLVADHSPFAMVTDFVRVLDEHLRESEAGYRPEHALRLIVAIDHGLVAERDGYPADDVVRRCDRLAREPAAEAQPAALVVVIADHFHRAVVRQGHRGIDPSSYAPLPDGTARIRVLGAPAMQLPTPASTRRVTLQDAREMLRELGDPPDH